MKLSPNKIQKSLAKYHKEVADKERIEANYYLKYPPYGYKVHK